MAMLQQRWWWCLATSFLALARADEPSPLLTITEGNFDTKLRAVPVALIAYMSFSTDTRFPALRPALRELAAAYEHAGIGVGTINNAYTELLDRFQIDSFPTLHWMDGSKTWPYYASEATPERYSGGRTFEELAQFVQQKTGIPPRLPEPPQPEEEVAPEEPQSEVHNWVASHDCQEPSTRYRACLRHKTADWHRKECASERHDYLWCMSGRWAVHRDHHQELARIYGEQFAER